MKKTIKNIGLDVHKNSISIGIADDGRYGEVRYYGKIDNDMNQLDKVIRKLISQGAVLRFVYEAGPCGYGILSWRAKGPKIWDLSRNSVQDFLEGETILQPRELSAAKYFYTKL